MDLRYGSDSGRDAAAGAEREPEPKGAYRFFSHTECEYFPCHKMAEPEEFNCMFCYCPLYALGERCGGNFKYTEKGDKDCSDCLIPHRREGYDHILKKYDEIAKLARKKP